MAETMTLRQIVANEWDAALEDDRKVYVADVADEIIAAHQREVASWSEYLARKGIVRMLKDLARQDAAAAEQPVLTGFPAVIAVATENDEHYVRTDKARFHELATALDVRDVNIARAQARRDAFAESLEVLRPVMEGTDLTVADALPLLD